MARSALANRSRASTASEDLLMVGIVDLAASKQPSEAELPRQVYPPGPDGLFRWARAGTQVSKSTLRQIKRLGRE